MSKSATKEQRSSDDSFESSRTYEVHEDVSFESTHALLGHINVSFKAGTVTPKSEAEEVALDALATSGLAKTKES